MGGPAPNDVQAPGMAEDEIPKNYGPGDCAEANFRTDLKDARQDPWIARTRLHCHTDGLYEMRILYRRGAKPEFAADWVSWWTIELSDVAHLQEAMRLSGYNASLEKHLAKVRVNAREKGIIAFGDQESGFPSTTGDYTPSHEQILRDRTPKFAIN